MPESSKKKRARRQPRQHTDEGARQPAAKQPAAKQPAVNQPAVNQLCPVVGIGASAGGLGAFKTFFSHIPDDSGLVFVLVPHLDPTHPSLMDELLGRYTGMPVCEAEDGMKVECNHVYIIPPGRYLTIREQTLHLSTPAEPRGMQTAIDNFLRSLALDQQERAIGIILSGTGSHGTPGLKEIKLVGGMIMVQEPTSAEYDQMPRNAIATGLVDYVLPPEQMPEALINYIRQPYLYTAAQAETVADQDREQINRILTVLRTHSRHDFRSYRRNMLVRRIQRRMGLLHIGNFTKYLDYLRNNTNEITALCKDLLIGVTVFFRDPAAYELLAQRVLPELVERHVSTVDNERPVRVWVPGCATGEEAYSIGMLLIEQFDAINKPANIQVFASDIDEGSLEVARQGIYLDSVVADISPQRLQRFFVRIDEHHYQVNKQLREAIVFAPQDLLSDAPFSKLDLVSCRNLLIYILPEVQQKVISLFHFALKENGYLLLGPSESIGRALDMFEPVSKKWRVYRRIGPNRPARVEVPIISIVDRNVMPPAPQAEAQPPLKLAGLMQQVLLEDFAPASVLVNRKYEILCFQGPTVNYLEFPPGEPTQNLMTMARQGLQTRIRTACYRAIQQGCRVIDEEARVRRDEGYVPCSINVRPLDELKQAEGLLLVTFQDRPEAPVPVRDERPESETGDTMVQQLEYELKATREDLQSTIEELESSNEQLKASNEEIMSMNEELQSTNEELETSKEEMQSLNEEMNTLNQQLLEKVDDLDQANNDITNLLTSSEVATVFLDTELRIKRFTPPTKKLLNLLASDVGRPFGDFAPRYHDATLMDDCRRVLDTLSAEEKEIHTDNQHNYLRRILPYRTEDNRIDGVVIVFIDITERVEAEAQSRLLAMLLKNSNDAVTMLDFDGRITAWNRGAEQMYGYDEAAALNMNIRDIVPADRRTEASQLVRCIAAGEDIRSFETQRLTRDGRTLDVWLTITPVLDESGKRIAVSTTERDITASKRASEELARLNEQLERKIVERTAELQRREQEFRTLADNVPAMFSYLDTAQRYRYVNRRYEEFWRRPPAEIIGMTAEELLGPANYASVRPYIETALTGTPVTYETTLEHDDSYYMQIAHVPDIDAKGRVRGIFSLVSDISELKHAEQALKEREDRLRIIVDTAPDAVITITGDGLINDFNRAAEMIFGYAASEVIGRNISMLMPFPFREENDGYLARRLEARKPVLCRRWEVVGRRKNGATFPMDLTVSEIDHIGIFLGIARDISAQRQLEQEVANASTYEQERIGHEIHDGLGQRLTGLSLLATTLRNDLADRELAEAGTATEIVEQLHQAIEEVRTIAHGLSPLPLVMGGLEEALDKLAEDTQASTGIRCRFNRHEGEATLIEDRAIAMQVYRIAQEAVHNAVKHAAARTITITLELRENRPELMIEDDGSGFQPDGEADEGIGLRIMRYRASIIGCKLIVESVPDRGTCIRCRFGPSAMQILR